MYQYQCPHCHTVFAVSQPLNTVSCPSCGEQFQVAFPQQQQQQTMPPQFAYGAPSRPYGPGVFDEGPSGKSRGVAGLLAILLGGLGVHYFYAGKTTGGILTILLCLVTCGVWGIIPLIQGILFFTMRQDEFESKFVNTTSSFPLF